MTDTLPPGRLPLVSCLMLTGKSPVRAEFAKKAVSCFIDQTYPRKELVIANHGQYTVLTPDVRRILEQNSLEAREVRIPFRSMGLMRQDCLNEAAGEYCIQWDDDDLSLPKRIEKQLYPLLYEGYEATFMRTIINWSTQTNSARVGSNRVPSAGIDGTIAHKRLPQYRYPDAPARKEDCAFRGQFRNTLAIPGSRLYIRLHHGDNIMPAHIVMSVLHDKNNVWRLNSEDKEVLEDAINRYYPHLKVEKQKSSNTRTLLELPC